MNRKKIKPPYKDMVYNNPRADKQQNGMDDKLEQQQKDRMLFDETPRGKDTVRRMADSYRKRQRQKKITKLKSDDSHWSGLEQRDNAYNFEKYVMERADEPVARKTRTYREFITEVYKREFERRYNT